MPIVWNQSSHSAAGATARRFTSHIFDRVLNFTFASDDGRMSSTSARFPGGEMTLGFVHSTGHRIRLNEGDDLTVLVPRAGRVEVTMGGVSHVARPGQILALQPGERTTAGHAAGNRGFDAMIVTLPVAGLARQMGEEGQVRPKLQDAIWLTGAEARRLGTGLADLATELRRSPASQVSDRSARRLSGLVLDLTASACLACAGPDLSPGYWRSDADLVRRALRLIQAGAEGPITLADVARDLGIGPRRLQLAFQRQGHPNPRDELARIRLDLARERLSRPDSGATVTDIAYDSGFAHLGRFSARYRRLFGELPSQTLARARGA